jgi:hypothetical protein
MFKNGQLTRQTHLRRGLVFGVIIVTALFAFEVFNYSTTEFALKDLLGDLSFAGIRWATILAIAFCGIDFAGIARLFTPTQANNRQQPAHNEAWYLFGAWLLAATMNAMLTWWGVSLAILERQNLGNAVASREVLLRAVPVFVAVLVWLIRVLIIGTFSVSGDRLFSQDDQRLYTPARVGASPRPASIPAPAQASAVHTPAYRSASPGSSTARTARLSASNPYPSGFQEKPEPTYHSISASPANQTGSNAATPNPTYNRPSSHIRR